MIFICWFAIVFMFSGQNGAESGKVSEKVTKKILQIKDKMEIVMETYETTNEIVIRGIRIDPITKKRIDKWEVPVRKLAHYGLFLCGGFLIYILINIGFEINNNASLTAIFLGLLLACIDEFHQIFSANRTPQLLDVGIDTIGVISGVMIAIFLISLVKKVQN